MLLSSRFGLRLRSVLSVILCLSLLLCFIPLGSRLDAFAESVDDGISEEEIERLLALNDYIDGEVIVIVDEAKQSPQLRLFSNDLLSGAEPIMKTTEEVYEIAATGMVDEANPPETSARSARTINATEEETISVLYLTNTGYSTEELFYLLREDPRVLHVEPNYVYKIEPQSLETLDAQELLPASETRDLTDYQWANSNTETSMYVNTKEIDFDINTPDWESRTDSTAENANGTVAVVDTGIDYSHPDLANVIRDDMNELLGYGGKHGFNADVTSDDPEPTDLNGHGTHCAGIIASEWNNFGTSGVASGVKMIGVRICDENSIISSAATLQAYEYLADAIDQGVDLKAVNNSWGGGNTDQAFSLAIAKVGQKGAISVVASGNDNADIDYVPESSAILQSNPYAVVVNSSTMHGAKSIFSNYGIATTNLFAPGSQILSTFPLSMGTYLPEAVSADASDKNIVYESFSSADPTSYAFKAYGGEAFDASIGTQSFQAYYDSNTEQNVSGALMLSAAEMKESVSAKGFSSRVFQASVTIPEEEKANLRYLGFHFYVPQKSGKLALETSIQVRSENGELEWRSSLVRHWPNEWRNASFDLQELLLEGDTLHFGGNDSDQIVLRFEYYYLEADESRPSDEDVFYFDSVGIGCSDATVPYMYLQGTSMAAPMATGAAMVLAKTDNPDLIPSEQALERAAKLSGSVRPQDAFTGLCSSGGALDLAEAAAGRYTPVPSTAELETKQGETQIVIGGWFFGDNPGTVSVGGTAATILDWSERSITVSCPAGLSAGIYNIAVTSILPKAAQSDPDQKRTGNKSFLFELPDTPETSSTVLYEKEYALPSEVEAARDIILTKMVGLGGSLYLITGGYEDEGLYSGMWKLDPSSEIWTKCCSLPEALDYISAVTYDGKILVSGMKTVAEEGIQVLYSYDPFADAWTELSSSGAELPVLSTLVNWNETLLLIGGAEKYSSSGLVNIYDTVSKFDLQTGTLDQIGTLTSPCLVPDVAVQGDNILVVSGILGSDSLLANHLAMPLCTTTDVSALVPSFNTERDNSFALTALADSFVFVGPSALDENDVLEDQDTYLLEVLDSSDTSLAPELGSGFEPFDKRVSHSQLFYPSATAYRGVLYAFGTSYYEENGFVLRATAVETLEQPGDLYTIRYHGVKAQEHANPSSYTATKLPCTLVDASGREGMVFRGWYGKADLSGVPVSSIAVGTTGDIELWAKWEPASTGPGSDSNNSNSSGSGTMASTGDINTEQMIVGLCILTLASIGGIGLGLRRMRRNA